MPLNRKLALQIASDHGFVTHSHKGSHQHLVYQQHKITIPTKKEFPIGTGKAILAQIAKPHQKTWKDLVTEYNIKL